MCLLLERLCWKELRQGWPLLVIGLLLPPLTRDVTVQQLAQLPQNVSWYGFSYDNPLWWNNTQEIALLLLLLAVVVRAALLAGREQRRNTYADAHFPVSPALATLSSLLVQGSMVLFIGLCAGAWSVRGNEVAFVQWLKPVITSTDPGMHLGEWLRQWLWQAIDPDTAYTVLMLSAGLFLSAYGITFVLAAAFSWWVGIAAGLLWVTANLGICHFLATQVSDYRAHSYYIFGTDISIHAGESLVAIALVTIAALVAAGVLLLPARSTFPWRRVLASVVLGIAVCGAGAVYLFDRWQQVGPTAVPLRLCSPDGALAVEVYNGQPGCYYDPRSGEMRFVDYQRQREAVQQMNQLTQPIVFLGRNVVILAQQGVSDDHITLLRWELVANRLIPLFALPANRGALAEIVLNHRNYADQVQGIQDAMSISPDGRYGVFGLPSYYPRRGSDLWGADLQQKTVRLLRPEARYGRITWEKDVARIGHYQSIDMATGRISTRDAADLRSLLWAAEGWR